MKKGFFFIILILAVACNKTGSLSCEQQYEKAKNDFNNSKFVYYDYLQSDKIFDRKEYSRILKENHITLDTLYSQGCIPFSQTQINEDCYKRMMNNNLHAKFGQQFFDSLRLKSTIKK